MKKRRQGDPQRQRRWEEVLRRWKESGQSVRCFCGGEGLPESAFYFWRRALAQRDQKAHAGNATRPQTRLMTTAVRSSPTPRRGRPSFLPVQVVEQAAAAPRDVEIVLGQGRTVRVRTGFDRQTLADVLAVLEARPC